MGWCLSDLSLRAANYFLSRVKRHPPFALSILPSVISKTASRCFQTYYSRMSSPQYQPRTTNYQFRTASYQPRTARTEPAAPQVWGLTPNTPHLPEEDPNRKMTIKEYFSMSKIPQIRTQKWNIINVPAKEKELLKLVILDSISIIPDILDIKNTNVIRLEYAIVAIQVFKRTGHLLSCKFYLNTIRFQVNNDIFQRSCSCMSFEEQKSSLEFTSELQFPQNWGHQRK